MPALRDFAWAFESSTADAGVTIPMCGYASGDLLVGYAMADTGTPTWTLLSALYAAVSDDGGAMATDTTDANSTTANDMELVPAAPAVNDAYYYGCLNKFELLRINIGTNGSATWDIEWEYYNGSTWATLPGLSDGTTNFTAGTGNRDVTFTVPTDWATTSINSITAYWVRSRVISFTSLTTRPLGTQAWVRDWKTLFTRNNTTANITFFKLATSLEDDVTVVTATNETYNGSVISVRDIDTSSPFPSVSVSSYSESNQNATQALGNGTITGVGQSFTGTATVLSKTTFYLSKTGSPTGNIVAKLYLETGTLGTSSTPTGSALAVSNPVDASTLTGSLALTDFYFPSWWFTMAAVDYVVTLEYSGGDGSNFVNVGVDTSSPGHAGNLSTYNGSWSAVSGTDSCFYVYRFNYNEAAATGAARFTMGTTTTDRDNSLILYRLSSASAAAPTFLEGPVNYIFGADGSAESMGAGWGFLKTAGTTANNVVCDSYASGNGGQSTIAVQPPLTGATVIPAYITTDNCSYVDPIHGVTAFNTNTALAATADTNFGTGPFSGTTANDATAAAIADVGINTFHSMGGMTNATTTNQISGAELVLAVANRPNVGTKNILCHVRASTPANLQRFTNIASGRGFWFGMRSNTTGTSDHKIWRVHAVDAPWGSGAHVPIIINSGAGNTVDSAGSLTTSAITAFGFWVGGITGTNTVQMGVGSLWVMDSTVISGGNSAEPMGIEGIIKVIANGKERMSAILQGAKQMLLLQDLQIGDGGTNPVYLNLDSTAIELPSQYNESTKKINYNSTDNVIGITYYPGSSDTIIHKNSVVSSPSRYKWGLHTSASTTATYDFSGLQVIGAGTVTLNKAITITDLTINDYSTLDISGLTFTGGTIKNMPATNDSVTTTSSTVISESSITTTTVTAGNRWASVATADLDMFSNNTFTGSHTSGHALRLTSTGTVTITGNTFTNYGPAARSFNAASGVNTTTDVITLDASHGYSNGEPAYFQDQGGTAPTGLTDGNLYYVRSESSTTITLYDTSDHAIAGGATGRADITVAGSGTQYIYSAAAAIYNNSGGSVTINVVNGSTPSIRNSDGSSTTVNNAVNLTVTVLDKADNGPIELAQVAIYKTSDDTQLMNEDTETVTAGSFVAGVNYRIVTVGTTDFTLIGASSNTIGVVFTATGVGSGTGTATNGIAVESFNYTADTPIYIRVRKSSAGATKYIPSSTTGTVTSSGFSVTVSMTQDTNA